MVYWSYFRGKDTATVNYNEYILSPSWEAKRKDFFIQQTKMGRNFCAVCHATGDLEVHHNTYAHLGDEPLEDLTLVCRHCHVSKIHGKPWRAALKKKLKRSIPIGKNRKLSFARARDERKATKYRNQ